MVGDHMRTRAAESLLFWILKNNGEISPNLSPSNSRSFFAFEVRSSYFSGTLQKRFFSFSRPSDTQSFLPAGGDPASLSFLS
jgi:hypothetical protein